jgi:hypothetical protein
MEAMSDQSPRSARRRTARRGRSLQWSDDAIAQAAQVGPGDADAAELSWDKYAPREARGLLEAVEEDDADE